MAITRPAGIPGGSNKYGQFNQNGVLGGEASYQYDYDTDTLSVIGAYDAARVILKCHSSQTVAPLQVQNSGGNVLFQVGPNGALIVNEQGADADTRFEGDNDQNLLYLDAGNDRVGIGNSAPGSKLDVQVAQSEATLSTQLLTNGGFDSDLSSWTAGANWAWNAGTAKHTAGAVEAISQAIVMTNTVTYEVTLTITGRTAGSVTLSFTSGADSHAGITATATRYITCTSTGSKSVIITPTTDFDGALDSVVVKSVTASSTSGLRVLNSDGTSGAASLRAGGTGLYNLLLGYMAGRQALSAAYNVAIGYQPLYTLVSGSRNVAIGYGPLSSLTTGDHNVALGQSAGGALTTGGYNFAAVSGALNSCVSGAHNVAIGYLAQRYLTGSHNIALGQSSGEGSSGASNVSGNVLVGYHAGNAVQTGGSYNLFLGYSAGDATTTGARNIVLGYLADTSGATISDQLVIGGYLSGDMAASGAIGAALRVTAPALGTIALIAKGASSQSANIFEVQDSSGVVQARIGPSGGLVVNEQGADADSRFEGDTDQNLLYIDAGADRVGIGNAAPGSKLDVQVAQSEATLSSTLLTNGTFDSDLSSWTAGAGWAWNAGTAKHTAGNVEAISQAIAMTNGVTYQIELTITGRTAGSITLSFTSGSESHASITATATRFITCTATGSKSVIITPTTDFDGALDSVTVKSITASAVVGLRVLNSDGTVGGLIVRAGGTGLYNLLLGYEAGRQITTGAYNNALGNQALYSNTTGNYNNALGASALRSNMTGNSNNALGYYALYSNTTGNYNNALGASALRSNMTGNYNNALGYYALYSNTTGTYNNALGNSALYYNTTGTYNNALGNYALHSNTTGNYNNALGASALRSNMTGSYNNALGYYALYYNTTGNYNNALGREAGVGSEGASDVTGNQLIGYHTGYALLTGGDYNVFVGHSAGDATTTGARNIVLGYLADTSGATVSDQLVIGGYLSGDMAASGAIGAALRVTAPALGTIGLIVKAAASQSANLLSIQDSAGNVLSTYSENGYWTTRKASAPADAELSNGEVALWLDATPGATLLCIKAKDSGGTVRTGTVALA